MTNLVGLVVVICVCVEIDRFVKFLIKQLEKERKNEKV